MRCIYGHRVFGIWRTMTPLFFWGHLVGYVCDRHRDFFAASVAEGGENMDAGLEAIKREALEDSGVPEELVDGHLVESVEKEPMPMHTLPGPLMPARQ